MDVIRLVVPAQSAYLGVVSLVIGGIGARLDLPYEQLDDLQLAVNSILVHDDRTAGDQVTVEIEVGEAGVVVLVGPLARDGADDPALRRVLAPLVASVEALDGVGGPWLELRAERTMSGARTG